MMLFTLHDLQDTFPRFEGTINEQLNISQIMTDSREKCSNALFIPIIGDTFNGHDYVLEAIQNGAIATLWDESVPIPADVSSSFMFFIVQDTIKALQQLAKIYRKQINPVIIGITGSNGKTTTKDLLRAVLQTKFNTYATVGNFNNHIGLPLTILQMTKETEVLVLEMGMNDFHEIDLLTKIAEPDYAIITNIGESHIEHLGSREGIAKAKLEIRNGLQKNGLLVIDGDEKLLASLKNEQSVLTCGFEKSNEIHVTHVELNGAETTFMIDGQRYAIPLLGKHHAKNASFVIAVAKRMGLHEEDILRGLKSLEHSNMRFEWVKGIRDVSIINDAYNASPTSMKAAIEVVKQVKGYKQKVVVLGDILELGNYADSFHLAVAQSIDTPINVVFTFGENAKIISDELIRSKPFITSKHFTSRELLIESLQPYLEAETLILFKASRGMAFEQFIQALM